MFILRDSSTLRQHIELHYRVLILHKVGKTQLHPSPLPLSLDREPTVDIVRKRHTLDGVLKCSKVAARLPRSKGHWYSSCKVLLILVFSIILLTPWFPAVHSQPSDSSDPYPCDKFLKWYTPHISRSIGTASRVTSGMFVSVLKVINLSASYCRKLMACFTVENSHDGHSSPQRETFVPLPSLRIRLLPSHDPTPLPISSEDISHYAGGISGGVSSTTLPVLQPTLPDEHPLSSPSLPDSDNTDGPGTAPRDRPTPPVGREETNGDPFLIGRDRVAFTSIVGFIGGLVSVFTLPLIDLGLSVPPYEVFLTKHRGTPRDRTQTNQNNNRQGKVISINSSSVPPLQPSDVSSPDSFPSSFDPMDSDDSRTFRPHEDDDDDDDFPSSEEMTPDPHSPPHYFPGIIPPFIFTAPQHSHRERRRSFARGISRLSFGRSPRVVPVETGDTSWRERKFVLGGRVSTIQEVPTFIDTDDWNPTGAGSSPTWRQEPKVWAAAESDPHISPGPSLPSSSRSSTFLPPCGADHDGLSQGDTLDSLEIQSCKSLPWEFQIADVGNLDDPRGPTTWWQSLQPTTADMVEEELEKICEVVEEMYKFRVPSFVTLPKSEEEFIEDDE